MKRWPIGIFLTVVCGYVLWGNSLVNNVFGWPMADHYIKKAIIETGSPNVVTAIYLNYRYYDTLFEALMLLFSVIAVIYMSVHGKEEHNE